MPRRKDQNSLRNAASPLLVTMMRNRFCLLFVSREQRGCWKTRHVATGAGQMLGGPDSERERVEIGQTDCAWGLLRQLGRVIIRVLPGQSPRPVSRLGVMSHPSTPRLLLYRNEVWRCSWNFERSPYRYTVVFLSKKKTVSAIFSHPHQSRSPSIYRGCYTTRHEAGVLHVWKVFLHLHRDQHYQIATSLSILHK